MSRPTMQELLAKQKEIAEKFNAQQIEQDKLRQEYEKLLLLFKIDRQEKQRQHQKFALHQKLHQLL